MKFVNIFVFLLVLYLIFDKYSHKQNIIYKNNIISQKNILFEVEKLVKFIDKKDFKIITLSFKGNEIELTVASKVNLIFKFLSIFEKIFSVKTIEFNYNKLLFAKIIFLKNSYKSIDYKNIKLSNIANVFIPPKNKKKIDTRAIIGDFIYIDKWYKIGDNYKGFKIYKIYPTYIELKKGKNIKKLYLFD